MKINVVARLLVVTIRHTHLVQISGSSPTSRSLESFGVADSPFVLLAWSSALGTRQSKSLRQGRSFSPLVPSGAQRYSNFQELGTRRESTHSYSFSVTEYYSVLEQAGVPLVREFPTVGENLSGAPRISLILL